MTPDLLHVCGLPEPRTLQGFSELISAPGGGETAAQQFIRDHPNILAPLELVEVLQHLRFPKRNLVRPTVSVQPQRVRIPDFVGVKLFPDSAPVVMELKSPQAPTVDSSTLLLSDSSNEVIAQLQQAIIHLLRPEGRGVMTAEFGRFFDGVLEDVAGEEAPSIDESLGSTERLISLMRGMQDYCIGIIGLIGKSDEFAGRPDILASAREAFAQRGCSLLMYDELLLLNEILVDYAARNVGLHQYFAESRELCQSAGTIVRLVGNPLLSSEILKKIQQVIHRTSEDVCVYGLGPPPATTLDVTFRANAAFNINMIWAPPTFLPGKERLLWAGRLGARWIVVKERLEEPPGAVVWYEFSPPVEVAAVS